VAQAESPEKAVERVANASPQGRLQSRLRHAVLKSTPTCSKKSPRCRSFAGAVSKRTRSALKRSNILRVKHRSARGGAKLRRL